MLFWTRLASFRGRATLWGGLVLGKVLYCVWGGKTSVVRGERVKLWFNTGCFLLPVKYNAKLIFRFFFCSHINICSFCNFQVKSFKCLMLCFDECLGRKDKPESRPLGCGLVDSTLGSITHDLDFELIRATRSNQCGKKCSPAYILLLSWEYIWELVLWCLKESWWG